MSESTDIERVEESIDSLRLPDSMLSRIPDRARNLVFTEGPGSLRLQNRVLREIVDHERLIYFLHNYTEKNDARERLTIDIEVEEDAVVLAEQVETLAATVDEMRIAKKKLERENERLRVKLAKTAIAVDSDK